MIKNNFIYATLATVLLCGAIDSPADAVRWEALHEQEREVCGRIHAHVEEVTAAVEGVCGAVQCMSAAGARHQEKLPEVKLSVANFRKLLGRVMGEQPEVKIDALPNVSAQGRQFVTKLALTLQKFDALFDGAHQPKQQYPRLALVASEASSIKTSFQNVLQELPPHASLDQVCTALLTGFEPEHQGAGAAAYRQLGADFWVGMPHARPAAAAAVAEDIGQYNIGFDIGQYNIGFDVGQYDIGQYRRRPPAAIPAVAAAYNYNAAGDDEEDDLHLAAEAAPSAPLGGRQDEEGVYVDSIMGDEVAINAYFAATEVERTRIRADKLRAVTQDVAQIPAELIHGAMPQEEGPLAPALPADDAYAKHLRQLGDTRGAEAHLDRLRVDEAIRRTGVFVVKECHQIAAGEVFKEICPANPYGPQHIPTKREFLLSMDREPCLSVLTDEQKQEVLDELGIWDILL